MVECLLPLVYDELRGLAREDKDASEVAKLQILGGLSVAEATASLG